MLAVSLDRTRSYVSKTRRERRLRAFCFWPRWRSSPRRSSSHIADTPRLRTLMGEASRDNSSALMPSSPCPSSTGARRTARAMLREYLLLACGGQLRSQVVDPVEYDNNLWGAADRTDERESASVRAGGKCARRRGGRPRGWGRDKDSSLLRDGWN